jgi:hypothetical protein
MLRTRAIEDVVLEIPKGSAGRGHGRWQAPHGNPPPPPPPRPPVSIEQLLAMQNELMGVLVQNEVCRGVERPQHHHHHDMNMSYFGFLVTHMSIFSRAKDTLEADDWLHITKSKFSLLHCIEYQKTLYATQQLRGLVGAWWASYTTTLPADHHVPWDEFHVAFCGHHLSASTMRRKLSKFLDLRQGNRSIYEYTKEFNNLAQYGGHHIDTDMKKVELFRKGFTIQLHDLLILSLNLSYNELASASIDQESTMRACEAYEEKKRKRTMPGASGGSSNSAPPM